MLNFNFYPPGKGGKLRPARGAVLIGVDGVPVRGGITVKKNCIRAEARNLDALGLSIVWPVEGFGPLQLETTRLPLREQPYHLHVELARNALMSISVKREEWGLFEYPGLEPISQKVEESRDRFVEALQNADDANQAARLADESLRLSVEAAEELCRFHARIFTARRRQTGGFARAFLGVALPPETPPAVLQSKFDSVFDFLRIPFVWRDIEPKEKKPHYDALDAWVKSCSRTGLTVRGGPLLNFGVSSVPDWLHAHERDYEAIFKFSREHIRRTVQRFAGQISTWIVASGLHADSAFSFTFEQIIDLTRMAVDVTRQAAPQSYIVLDLVQPWGEYFARNERTVPPSIYAEMALQSGINFDALGVQFLFGIDSDGYHRRDLMQISALIDRFANLGKPIHITSVAVPSSASEPDWNREWTGEDQAAWLAEFAEIVLSKPFVDNLCLQQLVDNVSPGVPHGGVFGEDLAPKPAFDTLARLRKQLLSSE